LAVTVIGGLLVATLLTLVVIPVVYRVFDRRRLAAEGPEPAPTSATTVPQGDGFAAVPSPATER
jgi:hypothetical protein